MMFFCLLLSVLFTASLDAASFPVLYCVNEKASAGECSSEAAQALEATKDWFTLYQEKHRDNDRKRRHLLECSRFCDSGSNYFTVLYPCDCGNNRRLVTIEKTNLVRSLQPNPLEGPIQRFKEFSDKFSDNYCKEVLNESHCIVTFVDTYDVLNSKPGSPDDATTDLTSDSSAADFDETYDPKTGTYQLYDPETGDLVKPDNDDQDAESGEGGLEIDDGNGSSGTGSLEDNGMIFEEIYDPVTKKYKKIDPNTGLPIDDEFP
jgi:hypothetical protein